MKCIEPQCSGELSLEGTEAYCTLCHHAVRSCEQCLGWNRLQSAFCQRCGKRLGPAPSPSVSAAALATEPARTRLDFDLRNAPREAYGFLWLLTTDGRLLSFNPLSPSIDRLETVAHLWRGEKIAAFTVRPMPRSPSSDLAEMHAITATADGIQATGLVSRREFVFRQLQAGETVLSDARDRYEFVEANGSSLFCLTRYASGEVTLLEVETFSGNVVRTSIPAPQVCGPVFAGGRIVLWSETRLWSFSGGLLREIDLPDGVALSTAPDMGQESGREVVPLVRLPISAAPVAVEESAFSLPGTRFGGPILLRVAVLNDVWSLSVTSIPRAGVLTSDTLGRPLLATEGHLQLALAQGFRESVADPRLWGQFAAYGDEHLRVFFCHSASGGLEQVWLGAREDGEPRTVTWRLASGSTLRECGGFWRTPGSLTAQIYTEGAVRNLELLSWSEGRSRR